MSGSERITANMNTGNKNFGKHIRQYLHEKKIKKSEGQRRSTREKTINIIESFAFSPG